jgi:hypothetical protein
MRQSGSTHASMPRCRPARPSSAPGSTRVSEAAWSAASASQGSARFDAGQVDVLAVEDLQRGGE